MKDKAKNDFDSVLKYAQPNDPAMPIVKKWIAQFGLNAISSIQKESTLNQSGNSSVGQVAEQQNTTFMSSILAQGFNWGICPEDLGGATKERLYGDDETNNIWYYLFHQAPQYIFNKNFYDLFSSTLK